MADGDGREAHPAPASVRLRVRPATVKGRATEGLWTVVSGCGAGFGAMTNGLWDQGPERRETRGNAMGRFVAGGRPIENRMWGPNGELVEILTKLVK